MIQGEYWLDIFTGERQRMEEPQRHWRDRDTWQYYVLWRVYDTTDLAHADRANWPKGAVIRYGDEWDRGVVYEARGVPTDPWGNTH